MKLKTIKLHKVDNQGNELDVVEYKILKIIKSSKDKISFIGTTGFLELGLVVANRVNDNGDIKYIVGNSLQIPFPIELDGDDDI